MVHIPRLKSRRRRLDMVALRTDQQRFSDEYGRVPRARSRWFVPTRRTASKMKESWGHRLFAGTGTTRTRAGTIGEIGTAQRPRRFLIVSFDQDYAIIRRW